VYGVSAAHETLHEFGMCEEYNQDAWRQGENQIYSDVGGCINPWDRPMYDSVESGQGQCSSDPVSGVTGDACGSPTEEGYSVMGQPNIVRSGGELIYNDLSQEGIHPDDVEPLKQFIEDHAGVTCN